MNEAQLLSVYNTLKSLEGVIDATNNSTLLGYVTTAKNEAWAEMVTAHSSAT